MIPWLKDGKTRKLRIKMTEDEILECIRKHKNRLFKYHEAIKMLKSISEGMPCENKAPIYVKDSIEGSLIDLRVKLAEVRGE